MTTPAALLVALGLAGISLVALAVAGYPLVLFLLPRRTPKPTPTRSSSDDHWPELTIALPAYNEGHQIRDTVESLLALDYPDHLKHILVVSDGSTDDTNAIVRSFEAQGVQLLALTERAGKCAAENAARPHLKGELVVNTDASVRMEPDALRALVAPFADPDVGVASGRDVSVSRLPDSDTDANTGESGYVGYEMWLRDLETSRGGIVGASGCLYAIRSNLHQTEVPGHLSRDFAAALIVRDAGLRSVSVPQALCYVPRTASLPAEYRRKVRTIARGMTTLWAWKHLLNPLGEGTFALKLLGHKVLRWLVPVGVVLGGLSVAGLLVLAGWGWLPVMGAAGLAGVVWAAWRRPPHQPLPGLLALMAWVVMGNVAVLHAWARAIGGGAEPVWEPTRRDPVASDQPSSEGARSDVARKGSSN